MMSAHSVAWASKCERVIFILYIIHVPTPITTPQTQVFQIGHYNALFELTPVEITTLASPRPYANTLA